MRELRMLLDGDQARTLRNIAVLVSQWSCHWADHLRAIAESLDAAVAELQAMEGSDMRPLAWHVRADASLKPPREVEEERQRQRRQGRVK